MPSNWQRLGDAQYRKWPVYDMQWPLSPTEMEQSHCFCAVDGGPILLFRKDTHDHVIRASVPRPSEDAGRVYSMSGKLLNMLPGEGATIASGGIGWTGSDSVVLVYTNGTVCCFDSDGKQSKTSVIDRTAHHSLSVQLACVYSSGVALLLSDCRVILLTDVGSKWEQVVLNGGSPIVKDPVIHRPIAFVVQDPLFTKKRRPGFLVSTADAGIVRFSLKSRNVQDHVTYGTVGTPALRLAVAPNGRFIACFTADGWLIVVNTKLDKKVLEFDTKATVEPLQLLWCGEDSVVMSWKQLGLLMVGPHGDWVKYSYTEPLFLAQEVDSCRIFTSKRAEILQRVPAFTEATREIGSFAPSAMLFDAIDGIEHGDALADVNIRLLKEEQNLKQAVMDCIQAAVSEFDIRLQQKFLRAAASGKSFADAEEDRRLCTSMFTSACNVLRALNAIRHHSIGMPMTIKQYHHLTPHKVIQRLIARKHFFLATKLCDYLRIPSVKHRVVLEWACSKIHKVYSPLGQPDHGITNNQLLAMDDELFDQLRMKMAESPGVSFVPLAAEADKAGRRRLATMLLDLEKHVHLQVLQLLEMKEFAMAMQRAIASQDPNLVHCCLFRAMDHYRVFQADDVQQEPFFRLLGTIEQARVMWINYLLASTSMGASASGSSNASRDTRQGKDIGHHRSSNNVRRPSLEHQDRALFSGDERLWPASSGEGKSTSSVVVDGVDQQEKLSLLGQTFVKLNLLQLSATHQLKQASVTTNGEEKLETLKHAQRTFSKAKGAEFHHAVTQEQIVLLKTQQQLEQVTGEGCFVGFSLCDTIYNCLVLDHNQWANRLKKDFRVTDKTFWRLKVKALVQCRDWDGLRAFSKEKRPPPIGYRPFAQGCIGKNNDAEAIKYIAKMDDQDEKLQLLESIKRWDLAAQVAFEMKDIDALQNLRAKSASSPTTQAAIDELAMKLLR